jgi:hypothetical protein
VPIPLRDDLDAKWPGPQPEHLRTDRSRPRRLLTSAAIYERASRTEAAKIGGVTLQIVRDLVLKFNAHGPEGLWDPKAPGLSGRHRAALAAIMSIGLREWAYRS